MRRVAVDAISASRRDDLDRRLLRLVTMTLDVHARVPYLHGAGMRAQQIAALLQIEGIVHRARRMVLRLIQRSEVVPVGFDFGAVGHIEADGTEDFLHAYPSTHDRMDAAASAPAPGQRDIERFFGQTRIKRGLRDGLPTRGQRGLDTGFGVVDAGARSLALLGRQLAEAFELFGERAGLA